MEGYDRLLKIDVKTIQENICEYVTHLRNNGKSHSTVSAYIAAIRHLFDMNDIVSINWKKVHSFEGEDEKETEDRPYAHSEISTMLQDTNLRNQAVILLMCGIIDQLTIDESNKLRQENKILKIDRNNFELRLQRVEDLDENAIKSRLQEKDSELQDLKKQMLSMQEEQKETNKALCEFRERHLKLVMGL